jgi:hypothetical protein
VSYIINAYEEEKKSHEYSAGRITQTLTTLVVNVGLGGFFIAVYTGLGALDGAVSF